MPSSDPRATRSSLARLCRALLYLLAGSIGLVLLVLLGLGLLNAVDEPELPATRMALEPPPNITPDERNLYFAMAGFTAAADSSSIDAGKARIARYDQAFAARAPVTQISAAAAADGDPDGGADPGTALPCGTPEAPVWSEAKKRSAEFAAARAVNRTVLTRYSELHAYTGYTETATPSYLAPSVTLPRAVRCLYLAATAEALQSRDVRERTSAARDFAQDISMWRTVLVGDGTMLSKMIAAGELHSDLRLAADAAADQATAPETLEELGLQPFDLADWRVTSAVAADFRAVASILRESLPAPAANPSTGESPGWWQASLAWYQGLFFKYNATLNLSAARLHEYRKATQSDPERYPDARAAFDRWTDDQVKPRSWHALYNPGGRILVALSASGTDYQLRAYDEAAFQRLVFLACQLRKQAVPAGETRKFMAAHPEWSTHPVSGNFFRWDPAENTLSLQAMVPHGAADAARYRVRLGLR